MSFQLTRRQFLQSAGIGAAALTVPHACAGGQSAVRAGDKPNVLLIMSDQQTLRAMSATGNKCLKTSNMDSIAAGGVRFANSYCTSPVCGPSRSSLVTGRMPHETGVNVNGQSIRPGIPTIGDIFRNAGYEAAWAGKWHLPQSYLQTNVVPGFEYLPIKGRGGSGSRTDDPVADEAIKFLRRRHSRPFLLGVSLHNPHDICGWTGRRPIDSPDVKECPPLPANFAFDPEEPEFIASCRRRTYYGPENRHTVKWNDDQWRRYLYAYYRFTEKVDRTIGRVLAALGEQNLEDDTLVLFTSDHGEGCAGHHWVVKLMLYQEPATVPLVVRYPGAIPAGKVDRTHLASGVDVVPTLCDYAGIRAPRELTGESLRPVIDDPDKPGRRCAVAELQPFPREPHRRGRMLRTGRYKYVAFSEGRNPEMLFDLQADPGETKNLARQKEMQAELDRHRTLLKEWIKRTEDAFDVSA